MARFEEGDKLAKVTLVAGGGAYERFGRRQTNVCVLVESGTRVSTNDGSTSKSSHVALKCFPVLLHTVIMNVPALKMEIVLKSLVRDNLIQLLPQFLESQLKKTSFPAYLSV